VLEKKLGDVGSFRSGVGFTEVEQGGKSGVPFFKVSDMNLETFLPKSFKLAPIW
jgi:type I restriction enzyme S subunit